MTRCCVVHCNGKCHLQPDRVVKNGKSCYSGHCNTADICKSKLSSDELKLAFIEFKNRCNSDKEDDNKEDMVLVWRHLRCYICGNIISNSIPTIDLNHFYIPLKYTPNNVVCVKCFEYCDDYNLDQNDFTNWSKSTCPYNGPDGVYMTVTEADKMYDDEYAEYGDGYNDGIKDSSGW